MLIDTIKDVLDINVMGKRRRPNRKPKYEDIGDIQVRMAGDALSDDQVREILADEIISELTGKTREDELVQEAMDYLPARREELQQLFLAPAFQQLSRVDQAVKAEEMLSNLHRLKGDVPEPIIRGRGPMKGKHRTFTQYANDPTTGQEIVVPVLNPDNTNEALSITYGVRPEDIGRSDIDQADEIVGETALRLMGNKVQGAGKDYTIADFMTEDAKGNQYKIDSMQIGEGPIELQTHSVFGGQNEDGSPMNVRYSQMMLDNEMRRGKDVLTAVDDLNARGMLQHPGIATKAGKLLRGDRSVTRVKADQEYDALIMPQYNKEQRNAPYLDQPRNKVQAPQGIHFADLPSAVEAVRAGKGGAVEVVPNKGGGNNKRRGANFKPFHKVNIEMDRGVQNNGQNVFTDLVAENPLLAQLLDTEVMKSYRV